MSYFESSEENNITGSLVSNVLESFGKDKSFLIKEINEKITNAFEDYGK